MEKKEPPKLTEEELAQVRQFLIDMIEKKVCARCKQPMEREEQIGHCVYAVPCGCRLYSNFDEEYLDSLPEDDDPAEMEAIWKGTHKPGSKPPWH